MNLGLYPLQIAFSWIRFAFAQYLRVEEILHLWDRVIAFDDLTPVAVLAAAIFAFRSKAV